MSTLHDMSTTMADLFNDKLKLVTRNGYYLLPIRHLGNGTVNILIIIHIGTRNGKTYNILTSSEYTINNNHIRT